MNRTKKIHFASIILGLVAASQAAIWTAQVKELAPKFNRYTSRAMVREVTLPTLANLDYSAYTSNPVLYDLKGAKPKAPAKKLTLADMGFDGVLADVADNITGTPLTPAETELPMAWRPLVERLWKQVKDPGFMNISSKVSGKKWADPKVAKAYQEFATAYLHDANGTLEIWVKLEFAPWVKFIDKSVTDEDKDGSVEVYGKLVTTGLVADTSLTKAIAWMQNDYLKRVLTEEESNDWIVTLASYWYPTCNTDIIDQGEEKKWPNATAEKAALGGLKGLLIDRPLCAVRGNPFGKIIYNVYSVKNYASAATVAEVTPVASSAVTPSASVPAGAKVLDTTISQNFKANTTRFAAELKANATYDAWAKSVGQYIQNEKDFIAKLPAGQMGFEAKENWLFFKKSLDYTTGGDLAKQAADKNPIPHLVELKKFFASQNINLVFMPIPNKEEVYYEKLPFDMPKDAAAVINPYSRKFLKDAQDAGIEVIDLLPLFLKAKQDDVKKSEHVYQLHDTHWSDRGLQIAAKAVADRIKQFNWYSAVAKTPIKYTITDTTTMRQGDIVDKIPEDKRTSYSEVKLRAQQVKMPGGQLYKGNRNDPILLMGDSFTGVFESVDCKGAGLGAHIAANTGLGVDIITSWGGGPLVRQTVMRTRKADLPAKRVVVYVMVARDLYNYSQGWAPLKVE